MKRLLLVLAACGGSSPAPSKMDSQMMSSSGMPADPAATYGPLEVGADWSTYAKVNTTPFKSETHGGRLVDTYVNAAGLAAYQAGEDLPVGAVVVKTSQEDDGTAGPLFVMEKRAAGFNPEHGDWWFALHWEEPPAYWRKKLGGPLYWRTPSKKAKYCSDCHDDFVTGMGGVPDGHRAW